MVIKVNVVFALLSLFLLNLGHAQTVQSFHLQGKFIPTGTAGYIYLSYPNNTDKWVRDSSLIDQGNFSFKGTIAYPTVARLSYRQVGAEIILEPSTMHISIKDVKDLSNVEMTGSKSQDELAELNTALRKVEVRWKKVMDTLTAVNKRSNAAFQEYRGWVLDPYFKELEELNHQFINKHPLSFASALILHTFARDLSADTLQVFYDRFPALVKQSRYGVNIAKQLAERKIAIAGTLAPTFSMEDINGKKLSLESLRGKYVLLDFWGSWCIPCRKGNPHLIRVYEKYKKLGFEIIGIAADDKTPEAWRKAVKEDKLPWLQILQGNLSDKYKITSYPTKVLIDKKGNIIGRFGEEQDSLDSMLEKIFMVADTATDLN